VKAFDWYKDQPRTWLCKGIDERMKDPEFRTRYKECLAESIREEKTITKLKRLLYEALPHEGRWMLDKIKEAFKEEKAK
jgi:hypothetical protein